MAYNIMSQGDHKTSYLKEFIIDTLAEKSELPKFPDCSIGSSCLVLENSSVWVLGNDNTWHEL